MTHVIATRAGVGGTAGVVQQQVLRFARVPISQPILMVVRHGRKIVRGPGIELTIEQGEAVAIAQDQVFDIENHVSPQGHYEAHWLTWDPALLRGFERQKPSARVVDGAHTLGRLPPAFQRAIDAAIEAIREPASVPDRIAVHRLSEVLAWIEEHGGRFEIHEPTTTTARVRRCILASPDAGWTSAAVAAELGMSEATLRLCSTAYAPKLEWRALRSD